MSARLVHADLEDTSVSEGGRTIATIRRVIEEIRPTTVYTHTIRDVHQDHRNAHNATLVAARGDPARVLLPGAVVDRRLPPDAVRGRSTSTSTARSRSSRPTRRRSRSARYLDEELLRSTARYWSRFAQARYVEPLEIVRDSDAPTAPPAARSGIDLPAREPTIDVA